MKPSKKAVIADIDNTLYNFVDFYGPAFRAMLHTVSRMTALPEQMLKQEFRTVYNRHGSLEYPYSIQEIDVITQRFQGEELERIIHSAWVAFGRSRKRRLLPYPEVRETLLWLKKNGYFLVAYTDAPCHQAWGRLHNLGLKSLFDLLLAWGPPGEEPPHDHSGRRKSRWYADDPRFSTKQRLELRIVNSSERKPNVEALRQLSVNLGLDPSTSWLIGDSREKDLMPARAVGLNDVWACYGLACQEANLNTVLELTPGSSRFAEAEESYTPSYVIKSFGDLRSIVPAVQIEMFP